jgi:hypothetical protein
MLNSQHITELQASGLSDETINAHKIRSYDQPEAERILGFKVKSGGWGIEYPGTNGNGPGFIRIKPDVPFVDESGRPAKYLTAKGAGNRLFIPAIYSEKDLKFAKSPIIITEGEKKSLKGAQELHGFVVLGLAGVWCFRQKERGLIDDFKRITWRGRDLYITYDSDVAAKREVQDAEQALAIELDKLGVASVQICRLPPSPKGEKVGLDDYLVNHSPETFVDQVLERALLWSPRTRIQVEDCMTFAARKVEHQEDIIMGGILPAQGIQLISAYSKMGKSIFAMNEGLCIASGKGFLGQFRVSKPRRILYINEEISEKQMQDRVKIMMAAARVDGFSQFVNFELINRSAIKIDTDEGLKTTMRLIRYRRPAAVFFDCLWRFHGKNENKTEDMQKVMERFDYLVRTFKIAIVIIHHHGQPQKESGRNNFELLRGSSVIGAAGDSYLTLTRFSKGEISNYQRLAFDLRNGAAPNDMKVFRNPETLWYELCATPAKNQKEKLAIENIVFTLKEMGGQATRQELIDRLVSDYGVSDRTAIRRIDDAVGASRIRRTTVGKQIELSLHDSGSGSMTDDK